MKLNSRAPNEQLNQSTLRMIKAAEHLKANIDRAAFATLTTIHVTRIVIILSYNHVL